MGYVDPDIEKAFGVIGCFTVISLCVVGGFFGSIGLFIGWLIWA